MNNLHRLTVDGAFDGATTQVSNGESRDGGGQLTRLTDLTVNEMGVYVTLVRSRALARSPGLLHTPLSTAVKSVKSVKSQDGKAVFYTPWCQTRCQFDGNPVAEVVA